LSSQLSKGTVGTDGAVHIRDIHQLIKAGNQSLHVTTPARPPAAAAGMQGVRRRYALGEWAWTKKY